jgi:hypothetical protein
MRRRGGLGRGLTLPLLGGPRQGAFARTIDDREQKWYNPMLFDM